MVEDILHFLRITRQTFDADEMSQIKNFLLTK